MTNIDATLLLQVFDIPKRQWEPDIEHHRQANNLGAGFEILKWRAFGHPHKLRNRPARLKQDLSDKTGTNSLIQLGE